MKRLSSLLIGVALALVGCGQSSDRYEVVGRQGIVRIVVVAPGTAVNDDALWRIADALGDTNGALQAMFWMDRQYAPTALPMTDEQLWHQTAQININRSTGLRELRHAPFGW